MNEDELPPGLGIFTAEPCWNCKGRGHTLETESEEPLQEGETLQEFAGRYREERMRVVEVPCPACKPPKLSGSGLTYVAVGTKGTAVVIETECGILDHELSEIGDRADEVGLDVPGDPGIYKAVVRYWGHKDYWGEYDSGYHDDGWEEVEAYPEPECAMLDGGCAGMRRPRDERGTWACDKHAGQVS